MVGLLFHPKEQASLGISMDFCPILSLPCRIVEKLSNYSLSVNHASLAASESLLLQKDSPAEQKEIRLNDFTLLENCRMIFMLNGMDE